MSGHNKWSKIKRKKGASDAKRSKVFSKIIKEITVAVREGNSADPNFNPRLRVAIANAKGVNMPKDNVDRAIKKAADADGAQLMEMNFEGYAPGGIALFVECTSDNQNRTVSNIRSYFNKNGGSLATNGSVEFLFDRKGIFTIPQGDLDEDDFTLELIDSGAEDVELDEGEFIISTAFEDFGNMQKYLEEKGLEATSTELQRIPKNPISVSIETAQRVMKIIEIFEDDDDVQAVYHNMDMTDEIIEALAN